MLEHNQSVGSLPCIVGQMGSLVIMLPPFPTREQLAPIFPPKMLQRLSAAGWLEKVDMGSRATHFSIKSVLAAIARLDAGELAPRLPSEPPPTGKRHIPGHSSPALYALAA